MNNKHKCKIVKMPISAYQRWKNKQENIQKDIKAITGKQTRIPMTRIFELASKQQIYLSQIDLRGLRKWKKYM